MKAMQIEGQEKLEQKEEGKKEEKEKAGKWYGKHVKTCCCMLNSGTQLRGAGRIGGSNHTCEI